MKVLKFAALLQESGWTSPAYICVDEQGIITSIGDVPPEDGSVTIVELPHIAMPGFPNSHSHAFQFAMAGLTEGTGDSHTTDDFWSWRQLMYSLAQKINPEAMEDIAAYLYSQMLCSGYTAVAEFHYLHHNPSGNHYSDRAEMSRRLLSAARRAGIDITLVPVYYRTGNFNKPAFAQQRRFICQGVDAYRQLIEAVERAVAEYPNAKMGVGVHSLRAAPIEDVQAIFSEKFSTLPLHLHISEQTGEVDACLAVHGRRPVQLLFDLVTVDQRVSLVHCTHLNAEEVALLAKSQANVVLCPTTEGNLGDGFFPFVEFLRQGGRFSIGSDSQVSLCFRKELQFLDYGQRLLTRKRNIVCDGSNEQSGDLLYWNAVVSGQQAMLGSQQRPLNVGSPMNAVLIDPERLVSPEHSGGKFLSSFIYAQDHKAMVGTICRGELVVDRGRHREEDVLFPRFAAAMRTLLA